MAIAPGTYNITIQRRSDHVENIRLTDNNGTAINLTGFTVAAQVWNDDRSTKFADWTVAYTNRTNGEFSITLSSTQTTTFTPNLLAYDVLVVNGSGLKEYYLEGTIFMSEGYTTT